MMFQNRKYRKVLCIMFIVTSLMVLMRLVWRKDQQAETVAKSGTVVVEYTSLKANSLSADGLAALRAAIHAEHAVIFNTVHYGPVTPDTTVLAVQVDRDLTRLTRLVAGLARVREIESVLLVFSHSYYDDRINELIRNVRFCRVMQLFYPYSVQLYPDRFPGIDPRDCDPLGGATEGCTPRDARLTEHKQHWWWKANYLFSRVGGGVAERASVMFLEEGQEVAVDALYMLRHLQRAQAAFPAALVLALGCVPPASRTLPPPGLLQLAPWRPPYHVGLSFNRTAWFKIAALSMHFCMYDDCSWSRSLLNVFAHFPAGHANMLACLWPRVVSGRAATRPPAAWPRPFPDRVRVRSVRAAEIHGPDETYGPGLPAGGWADARDQLFCLDPLLDVDSDSTDREDYLGLNDTLSV